MPRTKEDIQTHLLRLASRLERQIQYNSGIDRTLYEVVHELINLVGHISDKASIGIVERPYGD